jgi:CBS domain-containing protein
MLQWMSRSKSKMNVEKLMSKEVRSCSPHQSLADAARLMWERDCGSIPVQEDDRVVGMVTDRDICMAAYFNGRSLQDIRIADAMSRELATCRPEDTVEAAEAMMKKAQVRRLPVTDASGRLVGILSLNDIARALSQEPSARTADRLTQFALTLSAVGEQRHHPTPKSSQPS